MDTLNVLRASNYPRATQEIPKILEIIESLVEKGYAYPMDGDVYFRVKADEDYGKLSHRSLDSLMAGARVEIDENKEDAMDFVLWKGQKPDEPAWDSPWGPGRPGWHIECSAMSLVYLGETVDIHGGGQDLIFPHHENEIAQSEASTGTGPFSRYWVHNGLLQLGDDKMSKSLGNLVALDQALASNSPDALRLYFLSSHYRSPLNYSDEGCAAMERSVERLGHALHRSYDSGGDQLDASTYQERFLGAMDDDLNTPRALAALFDLAREVNRAADEGRNVSKAQDTLRHLGGILGLTFQERSTSGKDHLAAKPFIELLLVTRDELRQARQFDLADRIREGLDQEGVILEDTSQGTQWEYRSRG
jgi:cysteinyl-tRNA synthetase